MKTYHIPQTNLEVSRLAFGCMNLGRIGHQQPLTAEERLRAVQLIELAYEQGINFFDHADIYTQGKSEAVFGEVLHQLPGLRDKIILQSKCGIRFSDDPEPGYTGRYDFSRNHIVRSVEGSLRRLQTTHLDILLLHRPDPLVEPEEVAQAFEELHHSGMVRYFGVSNHTGAQLALLKRYITQPLIINQVELNLLHAHLISDGIVANREWSEYAAAGGILDYCRLHNILTQAWEPLAGGRLLDPPVDAESRVHKTVALVTKLALAKGVSKEAIVLAWLLRHPAPIQPIIETTNSQCLLASCQADQVNLSREEWYELFVAGRGAPVP